MKKIKLAVAIGAYNCENTLAKSLDSVLNQTFSDFICYVCDDGSTDNTLQIIKKYEKKDSRIVCLENEKNMGLAPTLNKIISKVKTEYLARMDGDDICEPERFEKELAFLESHPEYSMCGCNTRMFDDDGFWGERIFKEEPQKKDFLFTNPFAHPGLIFRMKDLLDAKNPATNEVYLENPQIIGRAEDYDLFMRLYSIGKKGFNLQEFLLQYREDRKCYSKRKFKYALIESKVRKRNYKNLGLMPIGYLYCLKPIIVGITPVSLRVMFHKLMFKKVNK